VFFFRPTLPSFCVQCLLAVHCSPALSRISPPWGLLGERSFPTRLRRFASVRAGVCVLFLKRPGAVHARRIARVLYVLCYFFVVSVKEGPFWPPPLTTCTYRRASPPRHGRNPVPSPPLAFFFQVALARA